MTYTIKYLNYVKKNQSGKKLTKITI